MERVEVDSPFERGSAGHVLSSGRCPGDNVITAVVVTTALVGFPVGSSPRNCRPLCASCLYLSANTEAADFTTKPLTLRGCLKSSGLLYRIGWLWIPFTARSNPVPGPATTALPQLAIWR